MAKMLQFKGQTTETEVKVHTTANVVDADQAFLEMTSPEGMFRLVLSEEEMLVLLQSVTASLTQMRKMRS